MAGTSCAREIGTTPLRIMHTCRGEMSCAKLSFTRGSQKVPIEVVVSANKATLAREVWNQDNSAVVGTEECGAEVGAGGAIKLSLEWKATDANPRYAFGAKDPMQRLFAVGVAEKYAAEAVMRGRAGQLVEETRPHQRVLMPAWGNSTSAPRVPFSPSTSQLGHPARRDRNGVISAHLGPARYEIRAPSPLATSGQVPELSSLPFVLSDRRLGHADARG